MLLGVGSELLAAGRKQCPEGPPSTPAIGGVGGAGSFIPRQPQPRAPKAQIRTLWSRRWESPCAKPGRRTEGPDAGGWARTRGAGVPGCRGPSFHVDPCTHSLPLTPGLPRPLAVPLLHIPNHRQGRPFGSGRAGPLAAAGNLPTQELPPKSFVHLLPAHDPPEAELLSGPSPFLFCH